MASLAIYVESGGRRLGPRRLDAAIIFEALAYGDVSTAAYLSIHNMASWMIDQFGVARTCASAICRA